MADEEKVTTEEQALADEWAAALAEAGDASQDDIDALMAQGGATPVAEPSTPRAPMEEFGASPKAPTISGLEGPNLDVILDIPVTISMEVGHTDISIRNLLQLNQGSVIELDRLAGKPSLVGKRTAKRLQYIRLRQRGKLKNTASADDGRRHRNHRIFRSGADEPHHAAFQRGQHDVALRFAPPVAFIQQYSGGLSVQL